MRGAGPPSVARVYADVNVRNPVEYSDYEALSIAWGEQDDYEVVRKVGRGKYSEVFEGRTVSQGAKCIIKVRRHLTESITNSPLITHPASAPRRSSSR